LINHQKISLENRTSGSISGTNIFARLSRKALDFVRKNFGYRSSLLVDDAEILMIHGYRRRLALSGPRRTER
jgi:hypothetical protein